MVYIIGKAKHFKGKTGAEDYANSLRKEGYKVRVLVSKTSGYDAITVGVRQSEVRKAIKKILG